MVGGREGVKIWRKQRSEGLSNDTLHVMDSSSIHIRIVCWDLINPLSDTDTQVHGSGGGATGECAACLSLSGGPSCGFLCQ